MTLIQVSVILPTYNESENIGNLILSLDESLKAAGWEAEIIVVDDNSPDGTAQAARAMEGQTCSQVICLVRSDERGLATAIRYGIEHARGEYVVVMDTDFNHAPENVPDMLRLLDQYDVIIGSRFVKGGGMEDQGRNFASAGYNLFLRMILFLPTHDNLSGFFCMRREQLMRMNLKAIFSGYGEYFMRLLYMARKQGWRLHEVPVFYRLRQHGSSKSHFGSMLRDYTLCAVDLRIHEKKYS